MTMLKVPQISRIIYIFRLLTSSKGKSSKQEKQLKEFSIQIHDMENVIAEQQWKIQQKSALVSLFIFVAIVGSVLCTS